MNKRSFFCPDFQPSSALLREEKHPSWTQLLDHNKDIFLHPWLLLMAMKIVGYKRINLESQWVSHVILITDISLAGTC